MTKEQAIKMLKSKMDGHTDTSYEWVETVRMAIKALEQEPVYYPPCIDCNKKMDEIRNAYDNMTTKALEQEPIDYKAQYERFSKKAEIVISQLRADRDRLQDAFDKIRSEIETKYGQCDICEYFEDYDYEENDISEYRPIGDIADILQIIDEYKADKE